ncbi:MAG: acyltransferase [Acidimicrobiales bacterium]|nr:acyltransferase [Acidimicrobiales bacterium]
MTLVDEPAPGRDTAPTTPTGGTRQGHLPYFPALDGLRGLAVIAVVLFHAGFGWASGGFLGVSTFFTLSGFLITALLLAERSATGRVDLRAFWRRRFRRLMPAALAALALAVLYGLAAADPVQQARLGGDVVASLAYVANWRFIISGQSYADLFAQPSPVLHFWSLAIEEQFYLLYPLLAFVVLGVLRWGRRAFGWLLVALIAVSLAMTLGAGFSDDRIYWGTDTRAAELLVGGLLAMVIYRRRVTRRIASDNAVQGWISLVGVGALIATVTLWVTTSQRDDWLYRGGLSAYSLLSAAVILAAVCPIGPIRALLGSEPLRRLGLISYGVYLYHWPVFLWISEARTGWPTLVVLVVRLAVTFALAITSYHVLEIPVRRGLGLMGWRPARVAPVAVVAIGGLAVLASALAPPPVIDFAAAERELAEIDDVPPAPPVDPAATEPPPARMTMFGDSTAVLTSYGLHGWADATGTAQFVGGMARLGCGIGRGGERASGDDEGQIPDHCNHWDITWPQEVRETQSNVAVIQIGPWEVADRRLSPDEPWVHLGDPVYDDYLRDEMLLATDLLAAQGAVVVWLTSPPVGAPPGQDPITLRGQGAEPERMERLNQLIEELPRLRPGSAQVVDLADWLATSGEDARLRPDGVHFGKSEAREVSDRFLGTAIVEAYERGWRETRDRQPTTGSAPSTSAFMGDPLEVLVTGDETALPIAEGLAAWGDETGAVEVTTAVQKGCGLVPSERRQVDGRQQPTPAACDTMALGMLQASAAVAPEVVLVVVGGWDTTDHRFPGDTTWRGPGDPTFDQTVRDVYGRQVDALAESGARVIWLAYPTVDTGHDDDAARAAAVNRIVYELAQDRRDTMDVIDFGAWIAQRPEGDVRPDGVVVGDDFTDDVALWLGPELVRRYDDYQASG